MLKIKCKRIKTIITLLLMIFTISCESQQSTQTDQTEETGDGSIFENETIATKTASMLYEFIVDKDETSVENPSCYQKEGTTSDDGYYGYKYTLTNCILILKNYVDTACTNESVTINGIFNVFPLVDEVDYEEYRFTGSATISGYLNGTCNVSNFVINYDESGVDIIFTQKSGTFCGVTWSKMSTLMDDIRDWMICD